MTIKTKGWHTILPYGLVYIITLIRTDVIYYNKSWNTLQGTTFLTTLKVAREISNLPYIPFFKNAFPYKNFSSLWWFFITSLLTFISYVTFMEQKGECIIRYFGRPCDEFTERVWPIKISYGARVTLFNKDLYLVTSIKFFLLHCVSHDTQRGGGARWRHIIQYLR
jgi:hypothetical protein